MFSKILIIIRQKRCFHFIGKYISIYLSVFFQLAFPYHPITYHYVLARQNSTLTLEAFFIMLCIILFITLVSIWVIYLVYRNYNHLSDIPKPPCSLLFGHMLDLRKSTGKNLILSSFIDIQRTNACSLYNQSPSDHVFTYCLR